MEKPPVFLPEKLLTSRELCFYTAQSLQTITKRFRPGGDWHADGLLIDGDYRLPVSAYNRWLGERRLAS